MEPLFTPDQLRDEARRQRRQLSVVWVISVLVVAGLAALARVAGEPGLGLVSLIVIVPALLIGTVAARREAARWDTAATSAPPRQWRGTVTGFSTNTYGVRWGVEVTVDHPPGASVRLTFRRRRNPGYGKQRLRTGDRVTFQLADGGKLQVGALRNERTGDIVRVMTRQRIH